MRLEGERFIAISPVLNLKRSELGQEQVSQHQVHRDESHNDAEELTRRKSIFGPPDIGGANGPDAPEQQDCKESAQEHDCARSRRESAIGGERGELIAVH